MNVRSTALLAGAVSIATAFATVAVIAPAQAADPIQIARLAASDTAGQFGSSVAVSGDTIAVGSPYFNNAQGAVYVFKKSGMAVTQVAKLTASDAADNDGLGYAVSVSGDTVVATAPYRDSNTGAAYVFVKPAGGWSNGTQDAILTASDGLPSDNFGNGVAVSGHTICVTQSGRAARLISR